MVWGTAESRAALKEKRLGMLRTDSESFLPPTAKASITKAWLKWVYPIDSLWHTLYHTHKETKCVFHPFAHRDTHSILISAFNGEQTCHSQLTVQKLLFFFLILQILNVNHKDVCWIKTVMINLQMNKKVCVLAGCWMTVNALVYRWVHGKMLWSVWDQWLGFIANVIS